MRSNGNREQEVSYTSRQLKRLAQELGISVMALSQLSRKVEERGEKRPRLSDLRESGAIEQDADVIGFLYRENYYNANADAGTAEVIISKQRNGGQDIITAGYDANHVRYYDLQTETPYLNENTAF
jgi:replicative DNA helicase